MRRVGLAHSVIAFGQHSFLQRNIAAVTNRWQSCAGFDRPVIIEAQASRSIEKALPFDQLVGIYCILQYNQNLFEYSSVVMIMP